MSIPFSPGRPTYGAEGGGVCAEGAVREDLDRTESEPRVSESGAESALDERVQDGIPRHRVDPDAGSSGTLGGLVGPQACAAHDVVNRRDPEALGHPCHGRKGAFERCLTPLKA